MKPPHIVRAEDCSTGTCHVTQNLVRGDRVSFVSVEQTKKVGIHPLDEAAMPSDIILPPDFVVVQDENGILFDRCHMHVVRWHPKRTRLSKNDIEVAQRYYGRSVKPRGGEVEVPKGPWRRVAKIAFIRYRREGELKGNYEHPFKPHVFLYATKNPLAWKLKLPDGCIVDERGFVRP